jgi:transposase
VDELIPENHLARLVSEVIDGMGIEKLLRKYPGGRRGKPVSSRDDD